MTAVLIFDDRRGVREGLARAVALVPSVSEVSRVGRLDALIDGCLHRRPDLVLIGTSTITGLVATKRVVAASPDIDVLAFGSADDVGSGAAAIAAGARGFLRWETVLFAPFSGMPHTHEVPEQIRTSPELTNRELTNRELTNRELQVLRRMSRGHSNVEIGSELGLTEDTVKTHARRLFGKLGVHDRAAAVAHGFRRGWLA